MMTKIFALVAMAIAGFALMAAFTQQGALVLRQENQEAFWPRYDTQTSGSYSRGAWRPSAIRSSYGSFRGGGPGAGK